MTIAQKIAELAEALGVDIPNDGQIADNLNAITLAKGGTITSNTNISEAIKNLANTIDGNGGSATGSEFKFEEGIYNISNTHDFSDGSPNHVVLCVVDINNYPELLEMQDWSTLRAVSLYFGEKQDISNLVYDFDYDTIYADQAKTLTFGTPPSDIVFELTSIHHYFVTMIKFWDGDEDDPYSNKISLSDKEGIPVHLVFAVIVNREAQFFQVDDIWHTCD